MLAIAKLKNGEIVWIEEGSEGDNGSGLKHIIERHGSEFEAIGITDIPGFLIKAIQSDKIVATQGKNNPRNVYEFEIKNEKHYVAVSIGKNGYIVGANIADSRYKEKKYEKN